MIDFFESEVNNHSINFFDTAKRAKQKFIPLEGNKIKMYTCGPTVYDYAHIGNFRTYVFEDLLRRTLLFFGYEVEQVMNITDIDDKTLKGAIKNNISLNSFTKPFKDAFFEDLKRLNIQPVEHYPCATDFIPQMIHLIEDLIKKGIAYKGADGSIYYAISKFSRYGCLSHLKIDELKSGASDRVSNDEYDKENAADFVLWKAYDESRDGDIFWESPFGKGRPGWHVECSCMAMEILGESLDIHVGGVDNIFPHHENEIAQSEAYSGKEFSHSWMHSEHLLVNNKKMSKSLGNFYTLRDLINKGYSGIEVRYMLLQTHYKTSLNFTLEGLDAARLSLQRLQDFIERMHEIKSSGSSGLGKDEGREFKEVLKEASSSFVAALADDLNISVALASLFNMVRKINILCDQNMINKEDVEGILNFIKRVDSVIGIFSLEVKAVEVSDDLQELLEKRQEARKEKNWKVADEMRDKILDAGYVIEDTPKGARLKKAKVKG